MEKRPYRKKLSSEGLIYFAGKEVPITVQNISITGLLAELRSNEQHTDIRSLFQAVKLSPVIDIYLQEMRIAGEAEVVRADLIDNQVFLALEFRNITYDVDNLIYERKVYRKNMSAPGKIIFNGTKYDFQTRNVSVDGLMAEIHEHVAVKEGTQTLFDFARLHLRGRIKVVWVEYPDEQTTLLGLQYIELQNQNIEGIPKFKSDIDH